MVCCPSHPRKVGLASAQDLENLEMRGKILGGWAGREYFNTLIVPLGSNIDLPSFFFR